MGQISEKNLCSLIVTQQHVLIANITNMILDYMKREAGSPVCHRIY